jgi:hypothetical protein
MRKTHDRELWCFGAPSMLPLNGDLINWTECWEGGGGARVGFLTKDEKFAKTSQRLEWMEIGR